MSATEPPPALSQEATLLTLNLGNAMVLPLPGEVGRVAVADEKVATVMVLSREELLIRPVGHGRTSLFVWMADGTLNKFLIDVQRDLLDLREELFRVSPNISVVESADGTSVVLRGEVADAAVAVAASDLAERLVAGIQPHPPRVINLLQFPEETIPLDADARLQVMLHHIDPRITLRRIQVGDALDSAADSYVLEGRVQTIEQLSRAITLAERQLGGMGGTIKAADDSRISNNRNRNFNSAVASSGAAGLQALQGQDRPDPGLAAQVSRGLILTSESGRVISFLEVDDLHQIHIAIRVLEIDRRKARELGINYRVDASKFSIANLTSPLRQSFGDIRGVPASVTTLTGGGNVVGAYVSSSVAILGAIDLLEHKTVARSVAEPNVLTLTGEDATVIVGGEVPIPTTSIGQVAAVQGFAFQSFGVRLDIRPTVDYSEVITLEVAPSIVRPDQGLAVGEVPGFQVQSVQTTARVRGGESLLLGGLLTFEDGIQERKVPLLGDIPVLSPLFSWKQKTREERELLFVITPKILPNKGIDGLVEPVDLPPLHSRDVRLGATMEPQTQARDGRPSSWVLQQRTAFLDEVMARRDRAVPDEPFPAEPADEPVAAASGALSAAADAEEGAIVEPPDPAEDASPASKQGAPSAGEQEPAAGSSDDLNEPVPRHGSRLDAEKVRAVYHALGRTPVRSMTGPVRSWIARTAPPGTLVPPH